MKQVYAYSRNPAVPVTELSDRQIRTLNREIDEKENEEVNTPLPMITPFAVIYAVIKDQMMMPFVQGLIWTSILILARPALDVVARNGYKVGVLVASMIGVSPSGTRI